MAPETNITAGNEQQRYYPYSGMFHVTRSSFWAAGYDGFTAPPSQNPDLFQNLVNTEPVLTGILARRRGYRTYGTLQPGTTQNYTRSYSYRNEITNERSWIFTSKQSVIKAAETPDHTALSATTNIFTPSTGATVPRMVLSRNFAYFVDGVLADSRKYDGGALSNFGIAFPQGATFTGTPATFSNINTGGTQLAWTNPSGLVGGGTPASISIPFAPTTSTQVAASNMGFSIPATTLIGASNITFSATLNIPPQSGAPAPDQYPLLVSVISTSPYQVFNQVAVELANDNAPHTYSLALDTGSLNPSIFNASSFGVAFQIGISVPATVAINGLTFVLAANGTAPVVSSTASAGNITLLSGRTYFFNYLNSKTGTRSGLSPASLTTGPITSKQVALTNIGVSVDPQVDTVEILATADGNDQTTLFYVGQVNNGTTTFTDNVPDSLSASVTAGPSLLTNNLYQETDAQGFLHGVANNDPPPQADFPTKHKGRLYLASGSTLFFSKSLEDVTTSTALVTTKWEEAWPATNQLEVSALAETISGMLSDGDVLWIGTERAIHRLIGDGPANFQQPEIAFNETGVLNQECWKIVFAEGQPVGSIWVTPDLRVIFSDFNTYQDIGIPVRDQLAALTKAQQAGLHACFVTKGPADYYMLWLPTGIVLVYNIRAKTWTVWTPAEAASTSLFDIAADGTPEWLWVAQSSTNLNFWDDGVILDAVPANGTSGALTSGYGVTIMTSWLDFGDSTIRKALNQILVTTDDPNLTVSVIGATLASDFTSGGDSVISSHSVVTGPLRESFVPLAAGISRAKWYRLIFSSPALLTQVAGVLRAFNVEAVPLLRY